MRVTVTRRDIQRGVRGDARACPIALALSRTLEAPVEVWSHCAVVMREHGRQVALLSPEVQQWIIRFDQGVIRKTTCPSLSFDLDGWQDVASSGFDES